MVKLRTDKEKMLEGLNEACRVTAASLGPDGRSIYISDRYTPRTIHDGVRIVNAIHFEDEAMNAGAYFAKNASAKTNDEVGDGTTSTVVFLKSIIEEAAKLDDNPADIRRSLDEALPKAIELLKEQAVPMKDEDIEHIAFLISKHKDIAKYISEIYQKLGRSAAIQIEDSRTNETKYEIEDGYRISDGYLSEGFFTDAKTRKSILEDVPVVVATQKLAKNTDLMGLAKQWQEKGVNQAVFFLREIDDQMLGLLVKNHLQGNFKAIVVRCLQDQLEDIAAATNATIIGEQSGVLWENVKLNELGFASKVVADKNSTLIQSEGRYAANRALELEVSSVDEPNMYTKAKMEERAARLRGKIAILRVGGYTELEREDKELNAEDAVKAIPHALEGGLVDGAGVAWERVAKKLGDSLGERILKVALSSPFRQLQENAGSKKVSAKGVVDPFKVEKVSLESAVSAAGLFLTTIAAVVEEKDKTNA